MADFSNWDIEKHHDCKQKEQGGCTHRIRMHKCKNQEEVYNGVRSEIIGATYFSHGGKKNSFEKESKAADKPQNKEKPQKEDKRIG